MPAFGRQTESQVILESLPQHHDGKFGFVIYRTVYGNDEEWTRCMNRLTEYVNAGMNRARNGDEIQESFVWDVMEDEGEFGGKGIEDVRNHFRTYSSNRPRTLPRYTKCIYIDTEVLESILSGEDPASESSNDILRPTAFVKVINSRYKDVISPVGEDEIPDPEERCRYNEGDEGFPPIDGCRRRDVGWMKVPARRLVPVGYQKLMGNGWNVYYVRPPGMFDD